MDLTRYINALTAYTELVKQAGQVKAWFEESGGAVPDELRTFLGVSSQSTPSPKRFALKRETMKAKTLPHPYLRFAPQNSAEDWIAIPAGEASLNTVILALVKTGMHGEMGSLLDAVRMWLPKTARNSIYNAINRLNGDGKLMKNGQTISINKLVSNPVLHEGLIWGYPDLMSDADVAHFRRRVIFDTIRENPGLERMQILKTLSALSWFPRRFNKDSLKGDLYALEVEKKIRKEEGSHGWLAIEKEVTEATS